MHIINTISNSRAGRWRATLLSTILALCAAMALAVAAPPSASADWQLQATDYDYFACPVASTATATKETETSLLVHTSIQIGHNPQWFSACRAWVYVDVYGTNGYIMKRFAYEPWAGPVSTNYFDPVESVSLDTSKVSHIRVTQTRR